MFYVYLKSLLSPKDSVSQALQERSSLIYYKLNSHYISPSSFLYPLKIFHGVSQIVTKQGRFHMTSSY